MNDDRTLTASNLDSKVTVVENLISQFGINGIEIADWLLQFNKIRKS